MKRNRATAGPHPAAGRPAGETRLEGARVLSGHCSAAYSGQDLEATSRSTERGMDREMWYIYTMEYYSVIKKN